MMSALVKSWARQRWLAGFLFLIPLLVILPHLNTFPYPPHPGAFSDLVVTHYPNAYFLRQALIENRSVPLWSPTILSGYPFAANPLSGLMYPPGWLALLLPLPLGMNLLAAFHLMLGGVGMLNLLRAEGVGYPAALLGGLAFEMMPKLVAHAGAGHLTLLYAIPWTPWLLWIWRVDSQSEVGQGNRRLLKWLHPGMLMAVIFLADVRWAVYAGILWWAYAIVHNRNKLATLRKLFFQTGLATLLSAPLALPLLEFTLRSTRGSMTAADILAFSLPPARLLGMVFPDFGGFYEWMLYPGAVVLCLTLITLSDRTQRREQIFWLWVASISLLASLGSFIPGSGYLAHIPGLSLLRVPARALFLTCFALATLAGHAVDAVQSSRLEASGRKLRLVLFGLAGSVVVLSIGVIVLTGSLPRPFAWGAGMVCLAAAWLFWGASGAATQHRRVWIAGILGISLLDWGMIDQSLIVFRPADQVLDEGAGVAQWLADQQGLFRVYSPSYSIPQQTAIRAGIQLADGVDPLQLDNYAGFMGIATGVPRSGYSVTTPPFANGNPKTSNAAYLPDPASLGILNVRYIAAGFDLSMDGLVLKSEFDGIRLYENLQALPRAWVQPENLPLGQQALVDVDGGADIHATRGLRGY